MWAYRSDLSKFTARTSILISRSQWHILSIYFYLVWLLLINHVCEHYTSSKLVKVQTHPTRNGGFLAKYDDPWAYHTELLWLPLCHILLAKAVRSLEVEVTMVESDVDICKAYMCVYLCLTSMIRNEVCRWTISHSLRKVSLDWIGQQTLPE